jgi:regulator of RNase E activity RraA
MGGHLVLPDDLVLADRDGTILIEGTAAEEVIAAAEAKMATEGEMVKAIRAGVDPQEAYMKYRVF